MSKKKIMLLSVVVVILFVSIIQINNQYHNKDVPEILFLKRVNYKSISNDSAKRKIEFYDKNGYYYSTDDKYVCSLSTSELIEEYLAGNLKNKIEFISSCDKNVLLLNYMKLMKVDFEKIKILSPKECPQIEVALCGWYCLYYDRKNEIKKVCIHRKNRCGDLSTDCVEANEIYEWWINSL